MSTVLAPWLVRAKASPPRPPAGAVTRQHLLAKLTNVTDSTVIALQAPAGFGKTFLLCQWRDYLLRQGKVVAWLSVDETDEPDSLVPYLAFSLHIAGLNMEDTGLLSPTFHGVSIASWVGRLLRTIEDSGRPHVLIVDDLERLPEESARTVMAPLLRSCPRELQLCLAFRHNPGLQLSQFSVRGDLLAISPEDLRFSRQEIARWFADDPDAAQLDTMLEQTGGWPVALQLMRSAPQADASSSKSYESPPADKDVAAYLREQLLQQLDQPHRDFLLDTSVVDQISIACANAVRDSDDSLPLMLELHEKLEGLFSPMQDQDDVYRLHPLVREFLRFELAERSPTEHAEKCVRAARWFEASGRCLEAMRYAVLGRNEELAARIFERMGGVQIFPREGMSRLTSALDLLKDFELASFPRVQIARGAAYAKSGRVRLAQAAVDQARSVSADFTEDHEGGDPIVTMVDGYLVELLLTEYGCRPKSGSLSDDNWKKVLERTADDAAFNAFILTWRCLVNFQTGALSEGFRYGRLALEKFMGAESRYGELFIYLHFGMAEMARGQLAAAMQEYLRGMRIFRSDFVNDQGLKRIFDIVLAEAYWEMGDARNAGRFVRHVSKQVRQPEAWFDLYMSAHLTAAEYIAADTGLDAALAFVRDAVDHATEEGLERLGRYLHAAHLLLLYRHSGKREAIAYAQRNLPEEILCDDEADLTWREIEIRALASIALATLNNAGGEAVDCASGLIAAGNAQGVLRLQLHGYVQRALAYERGGQRTNALADLQRALQIALPNQYQRPFLRAGREIAPLLRQITSGAEHERDASTLVSFIEELQANWKISATNERSSDRFSLRELEIIKLLSGGEPDKMIARNLGLSPHGVRYHLKKIYSKLGVRNRTQAVSRARQAGVL